jgi:hypothetical protein
MGDRIPRICSCGCGGLTNGDSYIAGHNRSSNNRRRDRQANRLPTNSTTWEKCKLYLKNVGNVFCQRVDENGYRCSELVWGFHHILPAEDYPSLATHHENLVGVCLRCHNKVEAAPERSRFVPTLYRTPMSDEPMPHILFRSGEKIPPGVELWTPENRRKRFEV